MYKKEIEEARNNVLNAVQQAKDVIINALKTSNNNNSISLCMERT